MNDWEELGKDILSVMWCIYVTIMFAISLFNVEEWVDVYLTFTVWAFCLAIPTILRGR